MELRPALPDDALVVARVHVRAWQVGYRGLLPAGYLESLRAEDRAARYTFGRADGPRTTVAVERSETGGGDPDGSAGGAGGGAPRGIDGDELVGFATIHGAELCALHVDPAAWNRGVGRALIAQARADLAAEGVTEAHVWVLVGNTRAERFYQRDGWTTDGTRRSDTVWGAVVEEIAYRRRL
jgi:ribosomal protein S18 acetylase RimI-like enzyme